MAKPDLGTKRVCVACGAHFYDLGKTPAICPKCHAEQPPDQPRPHRPVAPVVTPERRPKEPAEQAPEAALDIEEAPDEGEEDVIEDTSDLEDDPDTLGGNIEVGSSEEHDG